MADYLQDLLDRFNVNVNDPTQPPTSAFDATLSDEENRKKAATDAAKKAMPDVSQLPSWSRQAGVLASQAGPDQPPAIDVAKILANPANPAYADNPMASALTKKMAAAQAAQAQPPQPPPLSQTNYPVQPFPNAPVPQVPGSPPVQQPPQPPQPAPDDTNPDTNPPGGAPQTAQPPQKIPLPQERPAGAGPRAPQREVDAADAGQPGQPDTRANIPRVGANGQPLVDQAGMLPSSGGLGDIGSKIMSGLSQHSNLLLAMGAGMMGAPNLWQGLGRGFAYAGPAAQADIKQSMLAGGQQATYNALVGAGAPPDMARAATLDPDIKKQLLQSYIADRGYEIKPVETTNAWGEKETHYMAINKFRPQDSFDVQSGARLGGGGAPGAGGGAPTGPGGAGAPQGQPGQPGYQPQQSQFYAPGVNDQNLNQNLVGEDYLNQFSPEVKAAVQARISGLQAPARSNFGKDVTKRINMIAQKYEQDVTGMPVDDSLYPQRNKYATSLATPQSGVGLQKKGFQQGLEHFSKLSDQLVQMKLSNGFLGSEDVAEAINRLKAHGVNQAGLIGQANVTGQALAGEMGNLFSKTGGGVHERQQTKDAVSNAFKSGKSAAGALQGVVDLIDGGLTTMENDRNDLFPDARFRPRGSEFNGPHQQELKEHILHNIAILRGDVARDQPAAPAAGVTPQPKGTYNYDPKTGGFTMQQ